MVKIKRRQLAAIAVEDGSLPDSSLICDSNSKNEVHQDQVESSWVMIKKQRITIWIPPSSSVKLPFRSLNLRQIKRRRRVAAKGSRSRRLTKKSFENFRYEQKKSIHMVEGTEKALKTHIQAAAPGPSKLRLPLSTAQIASEGPDPFVIVRAPTLQPSLQFIIRTSKPSKKVAGSMRSHGGASEARTKEPLLSASASQPKSLSQCNYRQNDIYLFGSLNCLNGGQLQNQQTRALNLEKKLEKAGGLSRWLVSEGLGQFVQIFRRENVDQLQLLNLTMDKLKNMGANPVGPRRKLIHAIDRLCQPSYF